MSEPEFVGRNPERLPLHPDLSSVGGSLGWVMIGIVNKSFLATDLQLDALPETHLDP